MQRAKENAPGCSSRLQMLIVNMVSIERKTGHPNVFKSRKGEKKKRDVRLSQGKQQREKKAMRPGLQSKKRWVLPK